MDAKTIIDQTEKYYLPVFGRYQLALTHGKGCKLYDADGNEYLDFQQGQQLILWDTHTLHW